MTNVKYIVQYQPLRQGASRPEDWGNCHSYEIAEIGLLPSVGDFVNLVPVNAPEGYLSFSGKVRSRLFTQFTRYNDPDDDSASEITVGINIVIEETDDDWGRLIKE